MRIGGDDIVHRALNPVIDGGALPESNKFARSSR